MTDEGLLGELLALEASVAMASGVREGQRSDLSSQDPVVRIVNELLLLSSRNRASDIHFELNESGCEMGYRIDGELVFGRKFDPHLGARLLRRLKIMSGIPTTDTRHPYEGQLQFKVDDTELDIRVATAPVKRGETCALRLSARSEELQRLDALGMPPQIMNKLRELVNSPFGMVQVCGPTGAGKTTTMYAALGEINVEERRVLTIEDPVERVVPGFTQMEVDVNADFGFEQGLRTALRQDPDVIMVGEIRDGITAQVAANAAFSGHFVVTTLHATDTIAGALRLISLGAERFVVATSLTGVVAQRLVRRSCDACKEEQPLNELDEWYLSHQGADFKTQLVGRGCDICSGTGFYGRTGIYELLVLDQRLRSLLFESADYAQLRSAAIENGLSTMENEAIDLVRRGITTVAEIRKAVHSE